MSAPARDEPADNDQEAKLPVPYKVGYGRPPAEHRFRKGQSGNPRGRPKGAKNKEVIDTGFGKRATEEMLKLEAYRTITLREGEELIELPVIQAVFRAMSVSALKGNRFAQKTLTDMVKNVEQADFSSKLENFEVWFSYKQKWTEEIERCVRAGMPVPDPVPHPDDIKLDFNNGNVRFDGPFTKEAKDRLETAIARRDEAQREVSEFARRYRSARTTKWKQLWLDEWHFEQRMFDTINDLVGARYQTELQDRSYAEGASRKGEYAEKYARSRGL
jgi:hypothetical protein